MTDFKRKLIWFSEIRWDFLVTRKQQILSRFPRNWKILFVEPIVIGKRIHFFPVRRGNVIVVSIPYIRGSGNKLVLKMLNMGSVRAVVSAVGETILRFWLLVLGFSGKDRVIGLSSVHWGRFASKLPAKVKFYDCNDDHLKFAENTVWGVRYLRDFLRTASFMTYVSQELNDMVQSLYPVEAYFIGNGVDYAHFASKRAIPGIMRSLKRPIIGYAGTVDWIDPELLMEISRAYRDFSIVLIGPEVVKGKVTYKLNRKDCANVYYLGRVDYEALPSYVQSFDVAIIPFKRTRLTAPLNPNKLYEYLAAGLPVVTMNFSAYLRSLKGLVWVADSHKEFVRFIGEALEDNRISERREFARKHDWTEKTRELLEIIERKWRAGGDSKYI